jgi:hypothetical protein
MRNAEHGKPRGRGTPKKVRTQINQRTDKSAEDLNVFNDNDRTTPEENRNIVITQKRRILLLL